MELDLTDLGNWERGAPHAFFAWLRANAPVYWHEPTAHTPDGEGFWVVSRYADVIEVFHDPATYSSEGGGGRAQGGTFLEDTPFGGTMINMMDPPRHDRIRSLVNKGFTARGITSIAGELRERTATILAAAAEKVHCDFVRDVARELPLQAICTILGIPQEDRGHLCDDIDLGLEQPEPGSTVSPEDRFAATQRVMQYGAALIARKRARPGEDVLSTVIHAELPDADPPRLTDAEAQLFFTLLFVAGSETTRKAIAGGLLALFENPDQLAALRRDPALLATGADEMIRWVTPSAYKRRTATRDVELAGEKIRAGQKVVIWELSANRDETVFEDPFRFDLGRMPNPHLGFGHGVHYCLGANLARLEIRLLFEALLERFPRIEPDGAVTYTRDNRLFGLKSMPVALA